MTDSNGMVHQWIYVIVPTGTDMLPTLCAFCKACRTYFTERIEVNPVGGKTTDSTLPKLGCKLPEDGIIV